MRLLTMERKANICGERVRQAREKLALSQEALAAQIQLNGHLLTQKAISRIETGSRIVPDYEIPLLARALGVDPLWLIGLTDTPGVYPECLGLCRLVCGVVWRPPGGPREGEPSSELRMGEWFPLSDSPPPLPVATGE